MNKKKKESEIQESHPRIIEIEDQEIEEKKPPYENIIYFKIVDANHTSELEEKEKNRRTS